MKSLTLFSIWLFLLFPLQEIIAQTVVINEVLSSNGAVNFDEDGDYEDWIELYNYGVLPVNLNGYGLSDDESRPFKWVFPNVTLAPNSYMLVWASNKNRTNPMQPLHTNFRISASGETIILTHSNGTLLNKAPATALQSNTSIGRLPNGTGDFVIFRIPTPNQPNKAENQLISPPTFSHTSGFYTENISLALNHTDPNAIILYTTDGSEPHINNTSGTDYQYKNIYPEGPFLTKNFRSEEYLNEIVLQDKSSEPNRLANISTTFSTNTPDYFPTTSIRKANVIKAKAYVDGVASQSISHTYFINSGNAFDHTLPVVSITINENELFDYQEGIYVAGIDNLIGVGEDKCGFFNWNRSTELQANFQFFVNQQNIINQNIGLRIHGGCMRSTRLKSLRLYARSDYDLNNTFDHPFFEDYSFNSFKRLILRNSGNDGDHTLFRDAFLQKLVRHLRFDTQEYQPIVHYINGEYWGLINIRERYDRHYFERVYGIAEGDLDYLELDGRITASIKEGDNVHWLHFYNFIEENDLSQSSNYNHVVTQMDEENFMDYQIANIYFANTDWPWNNITYFRKKTSGFEANAPFGHDGRWRWVMYDTDFGFGLYNIPAQHNTLEHATTPNEHVWPTLFLRKLLENETFKIQFINRYADLINTAFVPGRAITMINQMKNVISSEIPNHRSRWAIPSNWEHDINTMVNFANQRPANARQHIKDFFDISDDHTIQLNVNNSEHGHIQVNSITIDKETPGVAENPYPWTGIYFDKVPVSVKAIPAQGYTFSHWSGASESSEAEIILMPTENLSLTAHFIEQKEPEPEVLYFWLMDNGLPNDTPLESIKPTYAYDNDLQKAVINFQSSLEGYPFNSSHPNWRIASMERRNQPTAINYIPVANEGKAFENVNMRGLQIKQPFQSEDGENTLYVKMDTKGYKSINLSFAVVEEGAAQTIKVDFYNENTNDWSVSGLPQQSFPIYTSYTLIEVDFSTVGQAKQNEDFTVRLRFDGEDMTASNGNRVTFNNISVSGIFDPLLSTEDPPNPEMVVYPNPFSDHIFVRTNGNKTYTYQIFDVNGRQLQKGVLLNDRIHAENLPAGLYILLLSDNFTSKRFKVLKR